MIQFPLPPRNSFQLPCFIQCDSENPSSHCYATDRIRCLNRLDYSLLIHIFRFVYVFKDAKQKRSQFLFDFNAGPLDKTANFSIMGQDELRTRTTPLCYDDSRKRIISSTLNISQLQRNWNNVELRGRKAETGIISANIFIFTANYCHQILYESS